MNKMKKLVAALLFATITTPALAAVTDNQVFAYAEGNYASLFSGASQSGQFQQYNYRYYPATKNYLAVDSAKVIYILGPASNGNIQPVGPVSAFEGAITAWEAKQGGAGGIAAGAGIVTTIAGSAGVIGGTDGTGAAARFNLPAGITVDTNGNLYVADQSNHTIRKITPAGVVTTLAGSAGMTGRTDGAGAGARFNGPTGITIDVNGNLYVADQFNYAIRKITPAGMVTTLAGSNAGILGSTDGTGSMAQFNYPTGITVDASGNLYVADKFNHAIRKITPAGVVSTLAGSAGTPGSTDGTGSAAQFNLPTDITADANGNLYVADSINHTIRKITPAGVVTTLAGSAGIFGSNDGTGSAARFNSPRGIAVDANANLYVAEFSNHTIRKITSAGVVTTLAGSASVIGSTDGTGTAARFYNPARITVDANGNLFVGDYGNHTIRKIQ